MGYERSAVSDRPHGTAAFAAASFIAFGAVLSVALTTDVEPIGISRLLLGLVMVILSGSALFTEINVLLPEMFLSRPRDLCRRCWRFWLITYLGNAAGALFVGLLITQAHLLGERQESRLFEILAEKMEFRDLGLVGRRSFALFHQYGGILPEVLDEIQQTPSLSTGT